MYNGLFKCKHIFKVHAFLIEEKSIINYVVWYKKKNFYKYSYFMLNSVI